MRLDTHHLQTLDQVRDFLAGSEGSTCNRRAAPTPTRVRGQDPATVRLRPAREDRQGPAAPLSGQGDRSVPGAGHPPAAPTPDHRPDHRPARRPEPAVCPPLHPRRHRAAGRDRRAARQVVRPGHARPLRAPCICSATAASSAWPASPTVTCTTCGTRRPVPVAAGATPQPTRPVQVSIGERRRPQPFGRPGWVRVDTVHQGDLDGIKGLYHLNLGGRGHAVPVHRLGRARPRRLPGPGPRRAAAGVPVHPARLPHRQRLGVRQPRSRRAARGAAHRRVHQVPGAPLHRQRAGREQERFRDPESISATATSPAATPSRSTLSISRSSPPTSTSTGPASSPAKRPTTRAESAGATGTRTS